MKRLHVHVAVEDLAKSIRFYSSLFGATPTVAKPDYAKWMLEDPRVNFAISSRNGQPGMRHLGIQAETDAELAEIAHRLHAAGETTLDEKATTCCYAKSNKAWVADPSGIAWETFFTFGDSTVYGQGPSETEIASASSVAAAKPQPKVANNAACCG
jgi:catechol 2,3-dioxygenase-like lactoylglutathione lyase family enzyme